MVLPPIGAERGRAVAAGLAGTHVLIVGDAMLDKFIAGRVTRLSPEAPVPVVMFDHESHRIGGAANVAHNVTALGGHATLVAVTGQDEAAATLAHACRDASIAPAFVGDPGRPTTTKVRIVTERNQQVARVDYEADSDISGDVEQRVVSAVHQHATSAAAIVISDYLKGAVTARVMQAAVAAGRERGIPVLVDPKIPHIDYYAGVTLITPNHHEAEIATNMRVRTEDEARIAARVFRERAACGALLMTRGDQGMWLIGEGVEGHLPAAAREVADVTGAGDTVIATLALTLAAGATLAEAAWLANEAAGIAVAKFGPSVVTPAELLRAIDASAGV
ncbi:MAG: bifunctional hydroxymethylpyrimidine kinase/phosphomethylpyrimidine kinase [Acidobacteria bacterium]|nr:bifunctional hydroxymethylpyrimidine kinase/phosphomethylpyrimidine kinase [Acidobacteriota bacterium]